MSEAQDLIRALHDARLTGYGSQMPGPLDDTFRSLAHMYTGLDSSQRAAVRDLVHLDISMLLLGFGDRLAILAARTQDEALLFDALIAHVLEGFRYDPRENTFRLAVVYHVAKKLGVDPQALFLRAALLASQRGADELRAFLARSERSKSLKSMGLREVETSNGVSYEMIIPPAPKQSKRS
jgi:hypothetical protein